MSADSKELREAAVDMRETHGPGHPRHDMWAEMSLWLDWVATCRECIDGVAENVRRYGREPKGPGKPTQMFLDTERHALAVARTYMEAAR